MKWLVCVDNTGDSYYTFNEVLKLMNHERDELFIICLNEILESVLSISHIPTSILADASHEIEKESKRTLVKYGRIANEKKIRYHLISGKTSHIGESICLFAKNHHIDYIVIGRRSMSGIKRFFTGSTSKYVMENADCSVVVVKVSDELRRREEGDEAIQKEEKEHHHEFENFKEYEMQENVKPIGGVKI